MDGCLGAASFQGKSMSTPLSRKPWLRTILFGALAVILVWQVATRTFGAYLAKIAAAQALVILPRQPTALLNLAERSLEADPQSPDAGPDRNRQIRAMVESALFNDPLNARGLRLLGQLADKSHDEKRAWQFMEAAARFSMNENYALAWLSDKSVEKKDYESALHYADILLRKSPALINYVMPTLVQIAEDKDASGGLRKLLFDSPPWRGQFFRSLPRSVSDARTPLQLLVA
jgi:hypothetical protein